MISARASLSVALAAFLMIALVFADEDTLDRAKDLYTSAAYEEALVLLDGLLADSASSQRVEVSEYRLFCLIALGRTAEARVAIQALVELDPLYQLSDERASPRVLGMFKEVRHELLPALVQRAYADAKVAFDRKDPNATVLFGHVIELLNDPGAASYPTLADLRIVVSGFQDLSRAFSAPPSIAPPEPQANASGTAVEPPAAGIYRESDPGIVAAVPVDRRVPPFVRTVEFRPRQLYGALELVVDENGDVVAVTVLQSIHPNYDPLLVKAARSWKYTPARKDGKAVAVRKLVTVRVPS